MTMIHDEDNRTKAYNQMEDAAALLSRWASDEEMVKHFTDCLPNDAIGMILLQLPLTVAPGNDEGSINRRLAFDVSETLGPDWCQTWYRFTVAMTKMQAAQ